MTTLGWLPSMFAGMAHQREGKKETTVKKTPEESWRDMNWKDIEFLKTCSCPNCKDKDWEYSPELAVATCCFCKSTYTVVFLTFLK